MEVSGETHVHACRFLLSAALRWALKEAETKLAQFEAGRTVASPSADTDPTFSPFMNAIRTESP